MSSESTEPVVSVYQPEVPPTVEAPAPAKPKQKRRRVKITGYEEYSVAQLRSELKAFSVEGISRMPKDSLIALLLYYKKKSSRKEVQKDKKLKIATVSIEAEEAST